MGDFDELVRKYMINQEKRIKKIVAPLQEYLDIPVFGYISIEADGRFCHLSNAIESIEYFHKNDIYSSHQYYRDPNLFRAGYAICPLSLNSISQDSMKRFYNYNLTFTIIQKTGSKMERFAFAKKMHFDHKDYIEILGQVDLLAKFANYFKREAKDLIDRCFGEGYNLKNTLGKIFHTTDPSSPLLKREQKVNKFLEILSPLSERELQCLDCFKQGKSAQGTAAALGISQRTVEHHFESIKDKLGCQSKWDLLNH